MRHALYPGSFDPLHGGHLDIIRRGSRLFGTLTVAALHNPLKNDPFLEIDERLAIIRAATADLPNVEVTTFSGLLMDYVRSQNAQVILKSLRNAPDFDYEAPMAQLNKQLAPSVETLFLLSAPQWSFVSSTRVRELWSLGVDVSHLVPAATYAALEVRRTPAAE